MFRTLSPGDSISTALRKLLQEGRRGKSGYIQVCNKGSRQSEHQRSGFKWRNLTFYVREDASLWAHWIHSFLRTSAIWGQSCFLAHLASCISLEPQQLPWGSWQHLMDHSFGSSHSHLETRNCWWLWRFLFVDIAGDSFISHVISHRIYRFFKPWEMSMFILKIHRKLHTHFEILYLKYKVVS